MWCSIAAISTRGREAALSCGSNGLRWVFLTSQGDGKWGAGQAGSSKTQVIFPVLPTSPCWILSLCLSPHGGKTAAVPPGFVLKARRRGQDHASQALSFHLSRPAGGFLRARWRRGLPREARRTEAGPGGGGEVKVSAPRPAPTPRAEPGAGWRARRGLTRGSAGAQRGLSGGSPGARRGLGWGSAGAAYLPLACRRAPSALSALPPADASHF